MARIYEVGRFDGEEIHRRSSRKTNVPSDSFKTKFGWCMWDDLESWIDLKAKNTQTKYRGVLKDFCDCLGIDRTTAGEELVKQVGAAEVARFVSVMKARPAQGGRSALVGDRVSLATVRLKVIVMHSIFDQLQAFGTVATNPWVRTKREFRAAKGNDRRPHQHIPAENVRQLFDLDFGQTAAGARDRAMLAAGFGGALRCNEILGLRVVDVRTGAKGAVCLHLRNTKKQRAELQVVPAWAASHIIRYLEIRRFEGAKDIEPLFIAYRAGKATSTPIIDRTFRRMFSRYMARVGLKGEYSPHCMRACAITQLLERGRNHRDVMKFSRHSSPDMVAHYDKLREKGAEEVAADLEY